MAVTIPAYILAGGRSSRFGADKALAVLRGKPLIAHVAEAVGEATVIAETPGKYDDLGLPTIADARPGLGPIGGLLTALEHSASDWLLLVACDMASVRPAWIASLESRRCVGARAVAFRSDRWQPMPGLYHREARGEVERQIAAGERSMQRLLDRLDAVALALPSDWVEPPGINTPGDLARFEAS